MNTAFDRAWDATGRAEGGYVDNPHDSGGPTNHGITERVARAHGYRGHMRVLPKTLARQIAKQAYWDPLRLDEVTALDERVAAELFDTGFNAGPPAAARMLQRALNALNRRGTHYADVTVDGGIGPGTLVALRAYLARRGTGDGSTVLLRALNGLQVELYTDLVERREKDEEFYYGWILHRVVI